jgi:hypothetical protein
MQPLQIEVMFVNGSTRTLAVDATLDAIGHRPRVVVIDGVAHFVRTDAGTTKELLAAPLVNILYWH